TTTLRSIAREGSLARNVPPLIVAASRPPRSCPMSLNWFGKWFMSQARRSRTAPKLQPRARLGLEALEDRTLLTVTLTSQFTGLAYPDTQGYIPPDTCGAAGPVKYVETVNLTLRISNKADGSSPVTDTFTHFMQTTGALPHADSTSGLSDPI